MDERFLTTGEVAAALGVSTETVRRYIREQKIRATALVRGPRTTFRIRKSDLLTFRTTYVRDTIRDDWER